MDFLKNNNKDLNRKIRSGQWQLNFERKLQPESCCGNLDHSEKWSFLRQSSVFCVFVVQSTAKTSNMEHKRKRKLRTGNICVHEKIMQQSKVEVQSCRAITLLITYTSQCLWARTKCARGMGIKTYCAWCDQWKWTEEMSKSSTLKEIQNLYSIISRISFTSPKSHL